MNSEQEATQLTDELEPTMSQLWCEESLEPQEGNPPDDDGKGEDSITTDIPDNQGDSSTGHTPSSARGRKRKRKWGKVISCPYCHLDFCWEVDFAQFFYIIQ